MFDISHKCCFFIRLWVRSVKSVAPFESSISLPSDARCIPLWSLLILGWSDYQEWWITVPIIILLFFFSPNSFPLKYWFQIRPMTIATALKPSRGGFTNQLSFILLLRLHTRTSSWKEPRIESVCRLVSELCLLFEV